jgi:hypothetical protein
LPLAEQRFGNPAMGQMLDLKTPTSRPTLVDRSRPLSACFTRFHAWCRRNMRYWGYGKKRTFSYARFEAFFT